MNKPKKLLVIVDYQYDFIMHDGKLALPDAEKIIKPAQAFLNQHGAKFNHILATRDDHIATEYADCRFSDEGTKFPLHCEVGTRGHEYVVKIPGKPTWLGKVDNSMWHPATTVGNAGLNAIMENWNKAEWEIVTFGVASDICVKLAVDGFLKHGYKVTILTNLCKGLFKEMNRVAAEEFAKQLQTKQLMLKTSTQYIRGTK